MKKLITIAAFFIILFPTIVLGANYYVKLGGNDGNSGLDDANAWATVGKVNSVDFADHDNVYFKRTHKFEDATLTLAAITNASSKEITIDAYDTGKRPWISGVSTGRINIDPNGLSITMNNIIADGQNLSSDIGAIRLFNMGGITLYNVKADGSWNHTNNTSALRIKSTTGNIEIDSCHFENWGDYTGSRGGTDREALYLGFSTTAGTTVYIHDSTFMETEGDAIQMENMRAGNIQISGNTIWNGGENQLDLKCVQGGTSVFRNEIGRDDDFTGSSGSSQGQLLQGGINVMDYDPPDEGSRNIAIYDNVIGPEDRVNLRLIRSYGNRSTNLRVFRNHFKKAKYQLYTQTSCNDWSVYSNVFDGLQANGMFFRSQDGDGEHKFYGNTFVSLDDVGNCPEYGMIHLKSSNIEFTNNIFLINEGSYPFIYVDSSSNPTINNNQYYNLAASPSSLFNWKGTNCTTLAAWQSASSQDADSAYGDPKLSDPANDLFYLDGSSPCVNTGDKSLTSAVTAEHGWHPNTNLPANYLESSVTNYGWYEKRAMGAFVGSVSPYNVSPEGSGIAVGANVSYSFSLNTERYDLYFDAGAAASTKVYSGTTNGATSYDPPGDMNELAQYTYYFEVWLGGVTEKTAPFTFTTAGTPPPDTISNRSKTQYSRGGSETEYTRQGSQIQ